VTKPRGALPWRHGGRAKSSPVQHLLRRASSIQTSSDEQTSRVAKPSSRLHMICNYRISGLHRHATRPPRVCANTARIRRIGPHYLLESTAPTISNTSVLAVVCRFRRSVVIGALPAPFLHHNELRAETACTFSKHVILMLFVKTQPVAVIGAPLAIF
jgi:hypothetical protein